MGIGRIKVLRGNKATLSNTSKNKILNAGTPFYDTGANKLYIGDGTTSIANLIPINNAEIQANTALINSILTGTDLGGNTVTVKNAFNMPVNGTIQGKTVSSIFESNSTYVKNATHATHATNADVATNYNTTSGTIKALAEQVEALNARKNLKTITYTNLYDLMNGLLSISNVLSVSLQFANPIKGGRKVLYLLDSGIHSDYLADVQFVTPNARYNSSTIYTYPTSTVRLQIFTSDSWAAITHQTTIEIFYNTNFPTKVSLYGSEINMSISSSVTGGNIIGYHQELTASEITGTFIVAYYE